MGKPEGKNQLKCLGTGEVIILKGSARYGSCLNRDDLSLDGNLGHAVVKNHCESLGCMKCLELLD